MNYFINKKYRVSRNANAKEKEEVVKIVAKSKKIYDSTPEDVPNTVTSILNC